VAQLPLPEDDQEFISVALHHSGEYPFNEGRLTSSRGLDIPIERFHDHFREIHVPHSTALHGRHFPDGYCDGDDGVPYLVGPLARLNLNHDQLPQATQRLLAECGISFPSRNMFHSVVARAAELHFAISEAIAILEHYRPEQPHYEAIKAKAGVGYGCTEAPRGILWHCYELDSEGLVVNATITPPTSQNQARMEEDLKNSLGNFGLDHDDAALRLRGEQVIRNYDPCISCATHFLKLNVTR
jgi:coenzyme F420-reducing hydrogenase alpha subunit